MDNGIYIIRDDARLTFSEFDDKLNSFDNLYRLTGPKLSEGGISDDFTNFKISKPFTGGGVLPDLAIPLADWLGFSEIYLLGCDGYHGGGDTEHFYDNASGVKHNGEKEKVNLSDSVNMLMKKGKWLYNCTPDSAHIEVPSIDLNDVLEED